MQLVSRRLRAIREKQGLTQAEVSARLGFKDRQTLAAVEAGQRKLTADELLRAISLFGVNVDYFTDAFRLDGEGRFSWRAKNASPGLLDQFEEQAGKWIAMYRQLQPGEGASVSPLQPRLALNQRSSFEEAQRAAEALGRAWDLGEVPALALEEAIRRRLKALVLYVDAPAGISGAACQLPELNAILINRNDPEGRRNYDLAHELFHLLTWDQMPPEHTEFDIPRAGKSNRIEQLADSFASALLMPEHALAPRWESRNGQEIHRWLNETASEFLVTAVALKWRLHQLGLLQKTDLVDIRDAKLIANGRPSNQQPKPLLFGPEFVRRLHAAVGKGELSVRRAASLLCMTVDDLATLFESYQLTVPFDL